jgi:hypothetical protein
MQAFEIPTTPTPQEFAITLGGVQYRVTLKWNVASNAWVIDFADTNGVPILAGVPLVTGVDLLEPYAYLNFGGKLYALTDNDADAPPTFVNLGVAGRLYWVTE